MTMGDPHAHPCPHRRIAFTYRTIQPQHSWRKRPSCIHISVPNHVKHTWVAFLAGACTTVPVNDYNRLRVRSHPNAPPIKVPYQNIVCTKCTQQAIADETHVVLHCSSTEPCRQRFQASYAIGSTLRAFVNAHRSNPHAAFFVHHCMRVYAGAPVITPAPVPPPMPVAAMAAPDPLAMHDVIHTDSDSTTSIHLGSLSASEYDASSSDVESVDSATHIHRTNDEHLPLLWRTLRHRRQAILD